MTELTRERRDAIRRELDDPSVDFEPYDSTVRALLDLADERDRYRALLRDALPHVRARSKSADRDNMRDATFLKQRIDAALEGKHD